VRAVDGATLFALNQASLFGDEGLDPRIALKIVRALASKVTSYLRSHEQTSSPALIQKGETDRVEFKSTLRWNLHRNQNDQAIENASLKTLAAYLNTHGGTLFVGVADDGTLLDLESDRLPSDDKMLRHLISLIRDRLGAHHMRFIRPNIERWNGKRLLRIDCLPADSPVYLRESQDESFYIRTGPASNRLRTSQIFDYIVRRFHMTPPPAA